MCSSCAAHISPAWMASLRACRRRSPRRARSARRNTTPNRRRPRRSRAACGPKLAYGALGALVDPGNQSRRSAAVRIVLAAELRVQQRLLRAHARNERRDRQRREQHADPGTKSQRPSQRIDEQAQIAGVADDAVDASRDQRMPGLNGDQPAESMTEHEDRPDAQRTADREENDAKPTDGISVQGPELNAVGVGGDIGHQEPDHSESCEHPAVAAILALARTEISAAEERDAGQHEAHDRKPDQGRVGKEGCKAAAAEDRKPDIAEAPHHRQEYQFGRKRHGRLVCTISLLIERREPPNAMLQAMRTARRGASENKHLAAPTGHAGWWCTLTSEAAGGRVEVRLRGLNKCLPLELGTPCDANLRKLHPVLQSDGDQGAEKAAEQVVRVL